MIANRFTKILIADSGGLFPVNDLFPADDLFPVESNVREITNIVAGSLKLDEIIAEKTPQFGQLYSSKFEVKIYQETDLSGKRIAVYQSDGELWHPVFFGQIDSCKTDRVGTDRTIIAYDLAYQLNSVNIADWWAQFWINKETATLKQVRDSLMNHCRINSEDVILPNDDLVVQKNVDFTSCTFQQMLRMICELNCCFPHINRYGSMEYIILNTEVEPVDLEGLYEWTNSNFEEYVTSEITGVQFYDSDNQLKYTVGEYANAYPISKNIFLYDASTAILDSVGETMLDYLSELVYNPASIKMIISDMELHLGDYVTAEGHNFYVFENSLSGSQLIEQTVKAQGDEQLYQGTTHLDYGEIILNQKIARVVQNVEEFYIEYGEYKTEVNGQITSMNTRISQNAESITLEVQRATGEERAIFANYKGPYVPTKTNYPAQNWNTYNSAKLHENETFYDTETGKYYRWVVTEVQ